MNRRTLLQALIAIPMGWMGGRAQAESPIKFVCVNRTPQYVRRVRITCNGHEVERCVLADAERGVCEVLSVHGNGSPVIETRLDGSKHLKRNLVYGNVRIELKNQTRHA